MRVLPWQESSPELDSAVRMDDYGDWIFHTILFVIVGIAILNAVLMSVLNRKRELGVMRALGLSGGEMAALVLFEGLMLTALAGVVGMALGFGVTWTFLRDGLDLSILMDSDITFSGLVFDPVMVPRFRLVHLLQSLGFIVFIGIAASLYPAIHASRMDPAEAVKWEG
jgi:ABC-type antimicrobial peptide transport system permease subunit